jgi:sugar lactone lactonase YvrE
MVLATWGAFGSVAQAGWTDGKNAASVMGQPDFTSGQDNQGFAAPTAATLNGPQGVALDPASGKLFVCDSSNSRVLRYPSPVAFVNGGSAEAVFGQADFATMTSGIQRNKFNNPAGITLDAAGRLWVADNINNRVVMFLDAANRASGVDADGLLGAAAFVVNPSGNGDGQMRQPQDVAVDAGGRVWVADWQNHRVLRFDNGAADAVANAGDVGQNLALADGVLGQSGFGLAQVNRGSGSPVRNGMNLPWKIEIDASGNLWVSDNSNGRVLYFVDPASKANGADADGLLGQINFTTLAGPSATRERLWGPRGLAVDSRGALWVSEEFNHRVVRFDGAAAVALGNAADSEMTPPLPDGVIGQADYVTNAQNTIASAVISPWDVDTSAYGDVWVAQKGNVNGGHRVSRFTPDDDSYRSDATIGAKESPQKGNQVYNLTGARQKVTVFSENRKKASVFARGGNDGEYADDFRILGPGSNRDFKVKYFATTSGKRNITGDVKSGGFIERAVLIGQERDYLVEVKPKASTKGKVKKLKVSFSVISLRGSSEDRVKGTVKTKK